MNYVKKYKFSSFDNVQLDVDVYYDDSIKSDKPLPALVWFFGGGWSHGSITANFPYGNYFSSRGYVVISADYRTYNEHKTLPSVCVKDAKYAIRWAYDHADELGIDKTRIAVGGGSAGGHLAACSCIFDKIDETDIDVTSIPKVQVLVNPVLDCSRQGFCPARYNENDMFPISPIHNMRADLPPAVLFHGTADTTVPYNGSVVFCGKMYEYGNTAFLYSYPGSNHSFAVFRRNLVAFADVISKAETFLNEYLSK